MRYIGIQEDNARNYQFQYSDQSGLHFIYPCPCHHHNTDHIPAHGTTRSRQWKHQIEDTAFNYNFNFLFFPYTICEGRGEKEKECYSRIRGNEYVDESCFSKVTETVMCRFSSANKTTHFIHEGWRKQLKNLPAPQPGVGSQAVLPLSLMPAFLPHFPAFLSCRWWLIAPDFNLGIIIPRL